MTEMVAYRGLTCQNCPIYSATRQENKEERARMRAEIVKLRKDRYGINKQPLRSVLPSSFIPSGRQLLDVFDHLADDLLRTAVEHACVVCVKKRVLDA
jgi:hypothetical protein